MVLLACKNKRLFINSEYAEKIAESVLNIERNITANLTEQKLLLQKAVNTENLVTVMWANEQFDPNRSDTFGEIVEERQWIVVYLDGIFFK